MRELLQFSPYVRAQKRLYLIGFVGSLFRFLIPLSVPLVIKYLFDELLQDGALARNEKAQQLLLLAVIMLAVFFLIRAPMEYVRQLCMNKANNRIMMSLRKDAFRKVQSLDSKYFVENKSGEVGARFFDDIEKIKGYMTAMFSNIWIEAIVLLFVVVVMLVMNVYLTLIAIALVAVQFTLAHLLSRRLKTTTRDMMNYRSLLNGFFLEKIQGALLSKLFASEKREKEQLDERLSIYETFTDKQVRINAVALSSVNVLSDITPFIVVLFGCLFVIDGDLSSGALIAFFAYVDRMRGPVAALVQAFPTITEGSVALQRIFDFLAVPTVIKERENAVNLESFNSLVRFQRTTFAYPGQEPVIKEMSFTIQKGKTYAFVGESGGGKSTIMQLITRMYDADSGEITIDGINIKDVSFASLRSLIGTVMQDSFLYSASILENIRIAKLDATEEEIIAAARKAYAHDFISAMPSGYYTEVGERGVKLSGGQKQRIALARIFLKDSAILLLDEATSALDNESEEFVQRSIEQYGHGKTVIMIAHRLSTVLHADNIFVVRKGEIVESGSHQQLLLSGGYYKELYAKQRADEDSGDMRLPASTKIGAI